MRDMNKSGTRRTVAGIIGLTMLVIMLFSAFFIAAETDHDCVGEDCPVCVMLHQCENTLRGMSSETPVQISVIIPFFGVLTAAVLLCDAAADTLISRKVRLNN